MVPWMAPRDTSDVVARLAAAAGLSPDVDLPRDTHSALVRLAELGDSVVADVTVVLEAAGAGPVGRAEGQGSSARPRSRSGSRASRLIIPNPRPVAEPGRERWGNSGP